MVPLRCNGRLTCCQGVAITNFVAGAVWAPLRSPSSAILGTHLVLVLLPLWTLLAYPMYQLVALQCGVMKIYAILSIALVIPLMQQGVLRFLKSWLLGVLPITAPVLRASTVTQNTLCYHSLPFISAVWTPNILLAWVLWWQESCACTASCPDNTDTVCRLSDSAPLLSRYEGSLLDS